jgi:hypothetical protein
MYYLNILIKQAVLFVNAIEEWYLYISNRIRRAHHFSYINLGNTCKFSLCILHPTVDRYAHYEAKY